MSEKLIHERLYIKLWNKDPGTQNQSWLIDEMKKNMNATEEFMKKYEKIKTKEWNIGKNAERT